MKLDKRYRRANGIMIFSFAFTLITSSLFAQQKIDPTLEVRRDFDGKLIDITKSKVPTNIDDSISKFNLSFDYTVFNKPVRDLYEFSPLPSAQIEKKGLEKYPVFQANLAASIPFAPYASLYYQPNLPQGLNLLLFGEHSSYFGKINNIQAPDHLNRGGLKFGFAWDRGEAGIDLEGSNRLATLHGFGTTPSFFQPESLSRKYMRDTLSRRFNTFDGGFYVRSTNSSPRAFNYLLSANYIHTDDLSKINLKEVNENYFKLAADIGPSFGLHHKVMAAIEFENAQSTKNPGFGRYSLTVHPRYIFTQKRWLFEAGVKINKSAEQDKEGFNLYFRGKASIALIPSNLWFYAETDGGTMFRSYQSLLRENNFISQAIDIKNTEIPFSGQIGFKGQVIDRFSYHLFGSYTRYKNEIFYKIADDADWDGMRNIFLANYASMNKFSAGAELSWKSNEFEAGVRALYNHFSRTDSLPAYNHSPLEIDIHARYNWRGRITAGAELIHKSSMTILTRPTIINTNEVAIKTKPYTTLNLSVSYAYNSKISVYLRGSNLFNSKGVWLADYAYRGMNITAGFIITL